MPHPSIDNQTSFAFSHLYPTDEAGRPLVVTVLQATFGIVESGRGRRVPHGLALLAEQPPVALAGSRWEPTDPDGGSPDPPPWDLAVISYRVEPCYAFTKPATDVVLLGHAHAPKSDTTQMRVGLKVGALEQVAIVTGDRYWQRTAGQLVPTAPLPFERIPLRYERAFGGWDRSHPDPAQHRAYRANPVGLGYRAESAGAEPAPEPEQTPEPDLSAEGQRLPNIEAVGHSLQRWGQIVPVVGFGFLSPDWEPRAKLAGTYDESWMEERMPYLAVDFDRRFFNAAPAGLVAHGYLNGREPVAIFGATSQDHLLFALPGVRPPTCTIARIGTADAQVQTQLDTVIIDTDERRVTLLFRGHAPLRNGPHDVSGFLIAEG